MFLTDHKDIQAALLKQLERMPDEAVMNLAKSLGVRISSSVLREDQESVQGNSLEEGDRSVNRSGRDSEGND
jgi:hypothetical protein